MATNQVLIIDDSESSADILTSLLEMEGVNPITATNGDEALEMVKTIPNVDVVFLDLEMGLGRSDGYRVLDLLRQEPHLARTVFIAYTAHLSEMSTARDVGFDGFIGKPLVATEFRKQWANIQDGKPVWAIR